MSTRDGRFKCIRCYRRLGRIVSRDGGAIRTVAIDLSAAVVRSDSDGATIWCRCGQPHLLVSPAVVTFTKTELQQPLTGEAA